VQGCSQTPSFYTETEEDIYSSYNRKMLSWEKKRHPFNAFVPDQPLFGYRCCPESRIWMINATPNRRCPASTATSSRRTRGSRGGGRREETATSVYT
jgi:hypothetical protein